MKKLFCAILAVMMLLSLAACGGGEDTTGSTPAASAPKLTDVNEIYAAMISGVDMPEMITLDSELMLDICGIKPADCKQGVVYLCSNSLQADEIWVLEASSGEAVSALKTAAQNRLNQKDAESVTYSPEQNKVVKAARIIQMGNYLVMICSPSVDTLAANLSAAQ